MFINFLLSVFILRKKVSRSFPYKTTPRISDTPLNGKGEQIPIFHGFLNSAACFQVSGFSVCGRTYMYYYTTLYSQLCIAMVV